MSGHMGGNASSDTGGNASGAGQGGRPDRARVRMFPPGVPLLVILLGVGLQRWVPILAEWEPSGSWNIGLGWVIVAAAIAFGAWAVILMRRSGQSENPWKPTLSIVERGPYRITRNPMYLEMMFVCVGFAVILWSPWILLLTPVGGLALERLVIRPEEAYLEGKFGEAYLAYKQRVRRWI